ncbi:MAG: esterase-like activity of phytase family protein, partial [Cyanobacteria bacterium]|nr:esterase-like activity of phytase family protein [Cyanobacteriota bacterium]
MSSSPLGNFTSLSTLSLAGGAEISAFHAAAKLLFTIGGSNTLSVVDLSNPSLPVLLKSLTLAGIGNSVAVSSSGLVAVAVEGAGAARYTEGKVAFFQVAGVASGATVTAAGSVAVGIVPDSLAFSPDGSKLVVVNEGEPNELYTLDPEGSISVISVNAATPANSTVQTVSFSGLNGRDAELAALGIRLAGKSGNTVAQNLEPEYVAISGDGKKAYVTFQENNAIGVIKLDGDSPTLQSLRSVGVQDYVRGQASLKTYDVSIASPGTTAAGGVVPGGGLSGLYATGKDSDGRLTFLAPADRGPNGNGTTKDVVKADGSAGTDGTNDQVQPFLLPDYQARFYKLALNETTGVVSVTGEVKLTRQDGTTPITGRSNGKGDQIPVDAKGTLLAYDTYGADLESIVQDKDGNIWMSDEYRPAIYKFDDTGKLIERYVPVGAGVAAGLTAGALGAEALPAEYAKRQTNRGFEGLAYDAVNDKLFAFVQSPLDDVGANDGTKGSLVRILEVSTATGAPTAEYLYAMAGKGSATAAADSPFYESKVDKIGDVAYDAARQVFYVMERDSAAGALSYKQVFEMSLKGATNILGNGVANEENLSIDALKAQGIILANKVLLTNLSSEGYLPNDKPEGLALLADGRLAVINDNDFGVTSLDAAGYNALSTAEQAKYSLASDIGGSQTYVYANGADAKVQLGIVSFTATGIDPSDKDGKIALLNNQNIYGLRMPDGIAAFQAIGKDGTSQTFTVIANEGDTRVRPDGDYTVDGTTTKDSTVFVDELRSGVTGTSPDNRLKIIKDLGNYDSTTSAYEQKFVFGGRSISILDSLGNVIWDSGDAIDRAAIAAGTYDDTRSDDKGSEPENVTVATIDGKIYAFVALERSGGVVSFDITDPYNATLVKYQPSGIGVVSPEGLIIIPADKSPNGKTLLVASNEVSKQLEISDQGYTLQLLHYYGESGMLGTKTAPIMGALIDKFDDQYANTLVVGEGDSFIPGPWLVGGADPSLNALAPLGDTSSVDAKSDGVTALGRPDVAIMNLFGTDVSALGNHEFDLGSPVLSSAVSASGTWKGAQFPLITSNLDFSGDSSLKGMADTSLGGTGGAYAGKEASEIKAKIAPYTVVTQGGEKIGIVGATTWDLLTKSSPNGTKVLDDGNAATSDLQEVAAYVQASVDKLIAAGVNKIIMIDQLDSVIDRNKELAPLLKGVDVMVAGGGHERLGDATDTAVPFNGHDANFIPEGYPIVVKDADGKDTLIVTSDTEYSYLGRLVVRFDSNGNVVTSALDQTINGAYASSEASLQAAYGSNKTSSEIISTSTIGKAVAEITNAIDKVIAIKDSAIFGYTTVYLEGDRVYGRAQEVNLGNLSADANLYAASRILPAGTVLGSLKNGGGIRASIGSVDADGTKERPAETSVKPNGAISQLEVENALRFDNKLMVFDTNATGLLAILNHAAGLSAGNGGYAQIGGVRFSFDPTKDAGKKVQDVAIYDLGGNLVAKVVENGTILASAPKTITLSTLNFMAQGGDGYPIKANGENFRYLLSNSNGSVSVSAAISEDLDFSAAATYAAYPNVLGEQEAFKSYLKEFHGTPDRAYRAADTIQAADQRIQNLGVKPLDTVLPDGNTPLLKARVNGLKVSEVLTIGEAVGSYIPTGTPDGMGAYLKDANTIR